MIRSETFSVFKIKVTSNSWCLFQATESNGTLKWVKSLALVVSTSDGYAISDRVADATISSVLYDIFSDFEVVGKSKICRERKERTWKITKTAHIV